MVARAVLHHAFTTWWTGYGLVKAFGGDIFDRIGVNGEPIVEEPVVKPPVVTPTVTPTVTTATVTPTVTDTKTDETVVTTHGVGKVIYRGNGAVIDYGVTPGASTVITVPAEQVAIVQTAIDSGVMSPGDGSQTILTVQAEEKSLLKLKLRKSVYMQQPFFNVMNQYGDNSSSLGGAGIRDTRVIGGTNLPFTYVKPLPPQRVVPPPPLPPRKPVSTISSGIASPKKIVSAISSGIVPPTRTSSFSSSTRDSFGRFRVF